MRPAPLLHADQVPRLVSLTRGDAVQPPDAEAFATALLDHNLGGFGVAALGESRWEPPAAVAERVRTAHAERSLLSGMLRLELAACAPVLAGACGVPPIVLKGPAVAGRLYPDPELRPYVDLDLMVPRASVRVAAEALIEQRGFSLARSERFFAAGGEPWPGFAERFGHELALTRTAAGRTLLVELHWRMGDDPLAARLDHAALSPGAEALPGLPSPARAPAAADELILLAVHLLHHASPLVLWCVDVARARDRLDEGEWRLAFERARERGLLRALHTALDRAAAVVGHDRPRPEPPPLADRLETLRAGGVLPEAVTVHVRRMARMPARSRAEYALRAAQAMWLRGRRAGR